MGTEATSLTAVSEAVARVERIGDPAAARLIPLDALRGVAIALVLFHHVGLRFPSVGRGPVGDFLVATGWAGVDLFFAISGFLITTILLRAQGARDLRGFYIKRGLRIVPLYAVALLLFLVTSRLFGNDLAVLHRLWINATFLTAWFIPFVGENGVPFTITWSVSVEEFAYIALGMLALAGPRRFTSGLVFLVGAALALRYAGLYWWGLEPTTLYYFAPARIDAVAMGGLAALLAPIVARRIAIHPLIPALTWLLCIGVLSYRGRGDHVVATIGYSLVALASAWLVLCVANLRSGRNRWWTVQLARLGLVSYFVYLFHGFTIAALARVVPVGVASALTVWGLSMAAIVLTYLPAVLSWRWFEYPLIKFGRHISRPRSA